jgi:hypothetical protein
VEERLHSLSFTRFLAEEWSLPSAAKGVARKSLYNSYTLFTLYLTLLSSLVLSGR